MRRPPQRTTHAIAPATSQIVLEDQATAPQSDKSWPATLPRRSRNVPVTLLAAGTHLALASGKICELGESEAPLGQRRAPATLSAAEPAAPRPQRALPQCSQSCTHRVCPYNSMYRCKTCNLGESEASLATVQMMPTPPQSFRSCYKTAAGTQADGQNENTLTSKFIRSYLFHQPRQPFPFYPIASCSCFPNSRTHPPTRPQTCPLPKPHERFNLQQGTRTRWSEGGLV